MRLLVAFSWLGAVACGDLSQAVGGDGPGQSTGEASQGTVTSSTGMASTGAGSAASGGADTSTGGGPAGTGSTTLGVVDDGGSSSGGSSSGSTGVDATTSASASSSFGQWSESSSGDERVTLGFSCRRDDDCNGDQGEQCCSVNQCVGTCMVPCANAGQCPFDGMGCEHGYCLFPCNASDDDCADWPGYTCQHGGTLCEIN